MKKTIIINGIKTRCNVPDSMLTERSFPRIARFNKDEQAIFDFGYNQCWHKKEKKIKQLQQELDRTQLALKAWKQKFTDADYSKGEAE